MLTRDKTKTVVAKNELQCALKVVPAAAVTKSPPPVIFCQVGVSHIYVTESQPPVIYSCRLKSVIFVVAAATSEKSE